MSPDIRQHRGAHPEDRKLFAEEQLTKLRAAVSELSWLLTRDYGIKGALKLVGDKFSLSERQRLGVSRAACSNQSKAQRAALCISVESLNGEAVIIDGFNLLVTVEAALSGGLLILCRDGCVRDLSSVHGSYRSVNETANAIEVIGNSLVSHQPGSVTWLLDRPISNSGRGEIEVIVADNDSSDATAEIAREHGARVVHVAKRRIAAARNGGARASRGEILCFIDADSAIHPQTFDAIDRAMGSGRYIWGVTGAKMERMSVPLFITYWMFMPMVLLTGLDTGLSFCRREDFAAVSGYDEG